MLYQASSDTLKSAHITAFAPNMDYDTLHQWSIDNREEFWSRLWDYAKIIGEKGDVILENGDDMMKSRFFPNAKLNFAENLLRKTGDQPALIFQAEDKEQASMSYDELRALVSRLQQAFQTAGLKQGDRVAAMVSNRPETVALMLAVTSLGGIWSSCSPDFGEKGVLDRFSQIKPTFFIAVDGYFYAGKTINVSEKIATVSRELQAKTLIITVIGSGNGSYDAFINPYQPKSLVFKKFPFNTPLYILYSSGTTGIPKCIVHGAGGTLIKHLSEFLFHMDLHENDRIFYFSTCGWMMWNWLVSGLSVGATLMLYDGSPFHPVKSVLFDYAAKHKVNIFGTSAKYIDTCKKEELDFRHLDLSALRSVASTGSPLSSDGFRYIYEHVKSDVHLASISGGTDIIGSFVGGTALKPVYAGVIQAKLLGMAVDIYDDEGKTLERGKGELVCTRSFPSQPLGFFNDETGAKYKAAYFSRFENIWCHGDFAEKTDTGYIIHGRSDATLNPGGVRIGTAEIYAVVEKLDEVIESIAVGQTYDNDTRIVLFVRLKAGFKLDEARIKQAIRVGASPRHVPAVIIEVADIPRTKSGKITELAVRDIINGFEVKNVESLANPESLALYRNLPQLI